jgi:hypothetical protein
MGFILPLICRVVQTLGAAIKIPQYFIKNQATAGI